MSARSEVTGAKRVVVKVGSSSLTTAAGGIDPGRVRDLVDVLAKLRTGGTEVVLVSSGAIAAGLAPLGLRKRPRGLPAQQAAASVGQGLLVHRYTEELARHGVIAGQVLLTVDDVTRRSHYRNAYQTFAKLLELGVLPIVNENDTVATSEIRSRPARSGSATTTGWRRWSRTSCTPTCWCCSPTSRACTTPTRSTPTARCCPR
jgi:glutamate 5-kinase